MCCRRKQYKTKITAWSLDKNFKRSELVSMLREKKRLEALGQSCMFIVSDRIVDIASLERASKRAKLTTSPSSDLYEPSDSLAVLPMNIRCIPFPHTCKHKSLPAALTAPTAHETLRSLFHHTSVLFHSFFDRDVLTTTTRRDCKFDPRQTYICLQLIRLSPCRGEELHLGLTSYLLIYTQASL
jgi:hypothetical protein